MPATFYRGGTSKAVIFERADLPQCDPFVDSAPWDKIFLAVMGSPDVGGKQLDGMGGGQSSLSKIAVLAPSERDDADVDYIFGQVGIKTATVSYRGNCGNISSAVGPYAVEKGWVVPRSDEAVVRIYNANTGKIIVSRFACRGGLPVVVGDVALAGLPTTGAPIRLSFMDPGGATTGKLLPTGNVVDTLTISDGRRFSATLIDVANPLALLTINDVIADQLVPDPAVMSRHLPLLDDIRVAAALAMGLVESEEVARTRVTNLPLVGLIGQPVDFAASDGTSIKAVDHDISVVVLSAGLAHRAVPLTGAMALAVATRVEGTLAHTCARPGHGNGVTIAHASGLMEVAIDGVRAEPEWRADSVQVVRTARRLFSGTVYHA
ncbi:MAG: PrpF domain-containing protein [Pelagibacterium sp.]|uniref:PrpF domain-containing protein n=1 Tax=Pelagibacterium sp. TaxID=1967288 RepID=UPI0032ED75D3